MTYNDFMDLLCPPEDEQEDLALLTEVAEESKEPGVKRQLSRVAPSSGRKAASTCATVGTTAAAGAASGWGGSWFARARSRRAATIPGIATPFHPAAESDAGARAAAAARQLASNPAEVQL